MFIHASLVAPSTRTSTSIRRDCSSRYLARKPARADYSTTPWKIQLTWRHPIGGSDLGSEDDRNAPQTCGRDGPAWGAGPGRHRRGRLASKRSDRDGGQVEARVAGHREGSVRAGDERVGPLPPLTPRAVRSRATSCGALRSRARVRYGADLTAARVYRNCGRIANQTRKKKGSKSNVSFSFGLNKYV